ncbi:unnamed protein product [Amoebophrya sp. A25]|nr:unnamed protein product [Amoebophrya sp. A25]|eukprot:GSA25T00016896001.1
MTSIAPLCEPPRTGGDRSNTSTSAILTASQIAMMETTSPSSASRSPASSGQGSPTRSGQHSGTSTGGAAFPSSSSSAGATASRGVSAVLSDASSTIFGSTFFNNAAGRAADEQWQADVARVRRRVQQLQLKASRPGSARGNNYREVRVILKELGLLDTFLQRMIVSQTLSRGKLLQRTDVLAKLTADVKALEKIIVGDGGAVVPSADNAVETYASGTTELQSGTDFPTTRRGEMQRQQGLVDEQEETLDRLAATLGSLKQIGQDINIEINYHNTLLEELGEAVDGTHTRMHSTQRRLRDIRRSKSSKCILCYIFTLIILIIIVLMNW